RNAVVGVTNCLVQAANLRGKALRDCRTRRIVFRAVDAHARRQALQRSGQLALRTIEVTLCVQRRDVRVDYLCHFPSSGLSIVKLLVSRPHACRLTDSGKDSARMSSYTPAVQPATRSIAD